MTTSNDKFVRANILGVIALVFWIIEPFIVDGIKHIPLFLLLTITFGAAFVISALNLTRRKEWRLIIKQPITLFAAGVIGIWASDMLYIYAARLSPIAYVEFIDYLWPPLFVLFACLTSQHKFSLREFLAHIVSIAGLLFLLDVDLGIVHSFHTNYMGYLLALAGAVLWAWFLSYSRSRPGSPSAMIGIYGGIGAILSLVLHLRYETFVMPNGIDLTLAVILGITGFGLAYQFWDYGVKYGSIPLLSQANYLARLLGIVLLYVIGEIPISSDLLLGGSFIISAFVLSNWQYMRNWLVKSEPMSEDEEVEDLL